MLSGMTDRPTNQTDRPALRPAAPEHASVHGHQPTDHRPATRPDQSTTRPARPVGSVDQPTDQTEATDPDRQPAASEPTDHATKATSRFRQWRQRKTAAANAAKKPTDQTAIAAAAAAHRRPATNRPTEDADVAPVPTWMKWMSVWLDRTFGAMPLIAPLLVSGYYTMRVFTDQPIGAHPLVAFFAATALEGGVWKLSRLYEKTLVAGDSTMALRLGIGGYLALISGLIYWHADQVPEQVRQVVDPTGHTGITALPDGSGVSTDALPAIGVAVMSTLGVYIWSRTARWARRRELHEQGRVDAQAPKFSALAWILCPVETPKALRHAVKYRLAGPVEAVADLRLYKSVGRPSVWPPIRLSGESTADRTGRSTDAPTRPDAIDHADRRSVGAPTTPRPQSVISVTDRPAASITQSRPTVPASRPQSAINRPAVTMPTTPTDAPTDRPAFTPAAVRNAGIIRDTYGTRTDLRLGTVRSDLRWSFDRADPALKAYLAGADQPTDQPEEPAALAHIN